MTKIKKVKVKKIQQGWDYISMKQFIEIIPQSNLLKQELYLPHLKTKSLSLPSTKLFIYSHRYQDRSQVSLNNYESNNQLRRNKPSIINLEEIQRKAKIEQGVKPNGQDRRKIQSQYETVDLWKQKHSIIFQGEAKKVKHEKIEHKQSSKPIILQNNINNFSSQEQNILKTRKFHKINSLTKIQKKNEVLPYLPEQFVVQKINQYKKLKKDEKLESILKKQSSKESTQLTKKVYKLPIPILISTFTEKQRQKNQNMQQEQMEQKDNNPSKWQTAIHYTDEQQNF